MGANRTAFSIWQIRELRAGRRVALVVVSSGAELLK